MLYPVLSKDFRCICKQYLVSKMKVFAGLWHFCKRKPSSNTLGTELGLEQTNADNSMSSPPETHNPQSFDRFERFEDEFPTNAAVALLINEHATRNSVRSSLISVSPPASSPMAEKPLDGTSMNDSESSPFLFTQNKKMPSAQCITINQKVLIIKGM